MPPKKKVATPRVATDHDTEVVEYKSAMMMRTFYEPTCSCGWGSLRYLTKPQALAAAEKHAKNPVF